MFITQNIVLTKKASKFKEDITRRSANCITLMIMRRIRKVNDEGGHEIIMY